MGERRGGDWGAGMGRGPEVGVAAALVGLLGGAIPTAVLGGSDPMRMDGDAAGCYSRFGQPAGDPVRGWSVGGGGFPPRYTCIDGNGQAYDVLSETAVWWLGGIALVSALVFLVGCAYFVFVLVTAERPAEPPAGRPDDAGGTARAQVAVAAVLGAFGSVVALVLGLAMVFTTPLLLPWAVAGYLVLAVIGATAVERSFGPGGRGPVGHWRRGAAVGVEGCVLQWLLFCLVAPLWVTDLALAVPPLLICAGAVGFALPVVGRRQSPR